jgi:hypothetical protein
MRAMLVLASILVLIMGSILSFLSDQTATFFAWTIRVPMTAAFMGAAYWSSAVLEFLASRQAAWSDARGAVPGVLAFTGLTMIISTIHIGDFHLNPLTVAITWVWLLVYALVPIALGILLVLQIRTPGQDAPRRAPITGWMRGLIGLLALGMLLFGLALLFVPETIGPLWPWPINALAGRAISAWLIGLALVGGQIAADGDLLRGRPAFISMIVFSLLQLIVVARFAEALAPNGNALINWSSASIWAYLGAIGIFLLLGAYGLGAGEMSRRTVA